MRLREPDCAAQPALARAATAIAVVATLLTAACADDTGTSTSEPTTTTAATTATTAPPAADDGLFAPSDTAIPADPSAARQRAVTLNLGLLLDDEGRPRDVDAVTANLFPDTVYRAVIAEVTDNGDGYTWAGHLEGIDGSSVTMLTTASVFTGQFAGPAGVYEVSWVDDNVYRIVEIDQSGMQEHQG